MSGRFADYLENKDTGKLKMITGFDLRNLNNGIYIYWDGGMGRK